MTLSTPGGKAAAMTLGPLLPIVLRHLGPLFCPSTAISAFSSQLYTNTEIDCHDPPADV